MSESKTIQKKELFAPVKYRVVGFLKTLRIRCLNFKIINNIFFVNPIKVHIICCYQENHPEIEMSLILNGLGS